MSFDPGFAPAPMPTRPQPRMVPQAYADVAPSRPRPIPLPRNNMAAVEAPRRQPERKPEPPRFTPLEVRTPESVGIELVTAQEVLPIPDPSELGIRLD